MNRTVSVIVPVFNVEDYLQECISSILSQTHAVLDVILIDDGSSDRSGAICDASAKEDDRIRVIHQRNMGLSGARNSGLDVASGAFVTFVDSDDVIDPQMVERLLSCALAHPNMIISCTMQKFTGSYRLLTATRSAPLHVLTREEALAEVVSPQRGSLVAACGKLYEIGLFHERRFALGRLHEDAFIAHRLQMAAKGTVQVDLPLYYYRQWPGSITQSFSVRGRFDVIDALLERRRDLERLGLRSLAATTSGQILSTFLSVAEFLLEDNASWEQSKSDMRTLAKRLNSAPQPARFRLFYSLFVVAPRLASTAFARLRARHRSPTNARL